MAASRARHLQKILGELVDSPFLQLFQLKSFVAGLHTDVVGEARRLLVIEGQ
jgi:hypothetical protein